VKGAAQRRTPSVGSPEWNLPKRFDAAEVIISEAVLNELETT
jgi:hypothetical protein